MYHRLKVVTIRLPSLAERREDIPLLIDHFLKEHTKRHNKTIQGISTAARRRLLAYDWPGNVRQLRNVIESMVVVDFDGVLDLDDLPAELAPPANGETSAGGRRARRPARPGGQIALRAGIALHRAKHSRSPAETAKKRPKCSASANGRCTVK